MVVAAWEVAKDFVERESALKAEAKVLQVSRPVGRIERKAMKRAVEVVGGKLASQSYT